MLTIGDKLFYIAEANEPGVQPRFVQAETADRLRAKLQAPVKPFSSSEPSIARVWDVLLGGKDNFAVDREQASSLLGIFPRAAELARESREFQARAVAYVADCAVRQFLDLGCGLPTAPNTHETAKGVRPDAVVVYVDNDEQVMTHAHGLLAKAEGVHTVAGDLSYPNEILYDWRLRQALDFCQPVCLVLAMTLHFYDREAARKITRRFINALPCGSFLILSVGQLEGGMGTQFSKQYRAGAIHHHNRETVSSFMDGLELVDPGVTEARTWRAPAFIPSHGRRGHIWAAVGRKTGGTA
ncbi:MAG: SAM-dependent methyltransferase [Streptosporangiaceae bacterium]|jgi:SAM-dependent methyltransferase